VGGSPETGGADAGPDSSAGGTSGGTGGTGGTPTASPLRVEVAASSDPAIPQRRVLNQITVGNVSATPVAAVSVLFELPPGLQFAAGADASPDATCGSATCGPLGDASWPLGTIAAGASRTITVNALVIDTVIDGDSIDAAFSVSGTSLTTIHQTRTVKVRSFPPTQLTLGSETNLVTAGQSFSFDVNVGHIGTAALTGAELRAQIPAGLTVNSVSNGGTVTDGSVVWPIGELAVGASLRRTVDVTVQNDVIPGTLFTTRSTLVYTKAPLDVDNHADFTVSVVSAPPPVKVVLGMLTNPVVPDGRLVFQATVSNTSSSTVLGVNLLLRVPVGLQFAASADADPNALCGGAETCQANTETTWSVGALSPGTSQTVTLNALVDQAAVRNGTLIDLRALLTTNSQDATYVSKTAQVFDTPAARLTLGASKNAVVRTETFSYDINVGQLGTPSIRCTSRASVKRRPSC
jgi:hypothetical protein